MERVEEIIKDVLKNFGIRKCYYSTFQRNKVVSELIVWVPEEEIRGNWVKAINEIEERLEDRFSNTNFLVDAAMLSKGSWIGKNMKLIEID